MAISEEEFQKLHAVNTTAEVQCRNVFNEISGIVVQVWGITGGRRSNS